MGLEKLFGDVVGREGGVGDVGWGPVGAFLYLVDEDSSDTSNKVLRGPLGSLDY